MEAPALHDGPLPPAHLDPGSRFYDPVAAMRARHIAHLATLGLTPDSLGRAVREARVLWAQRQPNPEQSWLVPWDRLGEADRDADRETGVNVALLTVLSVAGTRMAAGIPGAAPGARAPEAGRAVDPRCGSQGVDESGRCVRCGLEPSPEAVLRWLDAGDRWPHAFGSDGASYGERHTGSGEPVWRPANAGALVRAALAAERARAAGAERERDEYAANGDYLRGQIASLLADAEAQAGERDHLLAQAAAATRRAEELRLALNHIVAVTEPARMVPAAGSALRIAKDALRAARTPTPEATND